MWLSAIKLAMNAGSHIYKKKKETQMMMADAQYKHAQKMANGEADYQGKLLEVKKLRLERRVRFDNSNFANSNSGIFCMEFRSLCYG